MLDNNKEVPEIEIKGLRIRFLRDVSPFFLLWTTIFCFILSAVCLACLRC